MGNIFKGMVLVVEAIGAFIVGMLSLAGMVVTGLGLVVVVLLMFGVSLLLLVPLALFALLLAG